MAIEIRRIEAREEEGMTLADLEDFLSKSKALPRDAKPEAMVRWNGTIKRLKVQG